MLSRLNTRRLQEVAMFAFLLFKDSRDLNRLSYFLSTYSQDLYLSTPNGIIQEERIVGGVDELQKEWKVDVNWCWRAPSVGVE